MPIRNSRLAYTSLGAAVIIVRCATPMPRDSHPTISPVSQHASVPAASDCRQLGGDIAKTEQARRAALEKQKDAWKVVVPFAVAARYASGKSALAQADKQLAQLRAEFTGQGCDRHGS